MSMRAVYCHFLSGSALDRVAGQFDPDRIVRNTSDVSRWERYRALLRAEQLPLRDRRRF
jgi:hypothetical protein